MTDETEDERPFSLGDGDCIVFDPAYLDTETESEGVLAVQWSSERGLWSLVGRHADSGQYEQVWLQAGAPTGKRLRPVS